MAYENTSVPVSRSQEGIRKLVLQNKGTGVAFISQPPLEGFEAHVPVDGKTYRIRIMAECEESGMTKGRWFRGRHIAPRDRREDQVRRVWRVLYYHLKGVYEASNSGVMEFRELVLPYIVTADGRTVAQRIIPKLDSAITSDPARLLPERVEG